MNKKKKLVKVLTIIIAVIAALAALAGILYAVSGLLSKSNTVSAQSQTVSDTDIYSDAGYMSLDRDIHYYEYGSGEVIDSSNPQSLGDSAEFFCNYFGTVTEGDGEHYKNYFTKNYIENNTLPKSFTSQKLYDVSVSLYSRGSGDGDSIIDTFIVRFKIRQNNKSFYDCESDVTVTLVYKLLKDGDSVLIDEIDPYRISY